MLALGILTYAVSEVLPRKPWRPNSRWQVPEHFRRTPYVGTMAFLWGIALGVGWLTATSAAFLVVFLGMLAATPMVAVAAGATFGLVRGLTVLLAVGPREFDLVIDRFTRIRRHLQAMSVGTAVAGASLAAAVLISIH